MSRLTRYDVNADWEEVRPEHHHRDVAGVATNSRDQVYLFTRHDGEVLVFERDGRFVDAWGAGWFVRPHAITIGPDDAVYLVDDGDHTVKKYSPTGELLLTLGTSGVPSDTGYSADGDVEVHKVETVQRPGGPFHCCTDVAVAPNGDLYVSDGYGNCRVHRFSSDGELISSWGEIGIGPGEFHLPHNICITPDERVIVADRENDRLQVFDLEGNFVEMWTDVNRPCGITAGPDGRVYVGELWRPKGKGSFIHGAASEEQPGRLTILDSDGTVLQRWGASVDRKSAPGNFVAPHGVALDSRGDLYVAEVTYTFAIKPGWVSDDHAGHQIQKFIKQPTEETG